MPGEAETRSRTVAPEDAFGVAVFDVDGTLYRVNTLYRFLERFHAGRSHRKRLFLRLSRTLPGKAFWALATWLTPGEWFREWAFRSLRGAEVEEVEVACRSFVAEVLPEHAIAEVMDLLKRCHQRGQKLALISGSLQALVDAVGEAVEATTCVGVEAEVVDGRYTGRIVRDVRGRKLEVLTETFPELELLFVVTDNADDLRIVEAATRAVIVARRDRRAWWEAQGIANFELIEV